MKTNAVAALFMLLCCSSFAGESAEAEGTGLGIAVTPRNFPDFKAPDVADAYKKAGELCKFTVFIQQWTKLDMKVVAATMAATRKAGMTPVVAISPTTLTGGRKGLEIPFSVRRRSGGSVTFSNTGIKKGFNTVVRQLAGLKPEYLCLATEINTLAYGNIREYAAFAALYKEAYREVKKISPETKVFVSFQWDLAYIHDAKEPNRIRSHTRLIDLFRPELDVFAITSYPAPLYETPADLPANYYSSIFRHVKPGTEIHIMEIGWPTSGAGSKTEQKDFIDRLPKLLAGCKAKAVCWSLLHDVKHPAFNDDLNTTGLYTIRGAAKPGLDAFKQLGKKLK